MRGVARLAIIGCVALAAGLPIGIGLAGVSGDDGGPSADVGSAAAAGSAVPARAGGASGSSVGATTVSLARVRVLSAVLYRASTPSGQRRERARLSVRVRIVNSSAHRIDIVRPVLVAGKARVRTDPKQDRPGTTLPYLRGNATGDVTLRFEIAGAVTRQVLRERVARVIMAGRFTKAPVRVGGPVS